MLDSHKITDADIDDFLQAHNEGVEDKLHLSFCDDRKEFIKGWNDVQACPGSGKTTLIAAKLIILAKKWSARHRGICVLTHTNVARDEILSRLENNPHGYKLLSYPHFIGTIQEFVNRFLGLPYIRNHYDFSRFVEEDVGHVEVRRANINGHQIEDICRNLYRQCNQAPFDDIKDYLGSLHYINADGDLKFYKQNNSYEVSRASSVSARRAMLVALKNAMCSRGIFNYRDSYAFAEMLLRGSDGLMEALQKRFPLVFIDEMQDTQKFQDELVNSIFEVENVQIQRFGDPDQAIYDNIGNEDPNETFNENPDLEILAHSHRFTNCIAEKVSRLSLSQIGAIQAKDIPEPRVNHTVFIYDDDTKRNVLNAFARLVHASDPESNWKRVKAVGATEGQGGFISQYWAGFDKRKSVSNPRPKKLIDAVSRNWTAVTDAHSGIQYRLIVQTIIDALRVGGVLDERSNAHRYFNHDSLKSWLIENDKIQEFRNLVTGWIYSPPKDEETWSAQLATLKAIFDLPNNAETRTFLEYSQGAPEADQGANVKSNLFLADNGCSIEVGTIHSVKGETHDATLVLETQNHRYDLEVMLPYFLGELPSNELANEDLRLKPHHNANPPQNKQFLRQLYVACSRPRHLLCLAVHSDHVSAKQRETLEAHGWSLMLLNGAEHG